ncbi:MAG: hypothetical protein QG572_55 [Pseudomonadota bacterium]|nr:hypothetical protein [Pseudomonadota bacterium]
MSLKKSVTAITLGLLLASSASASNSLTFQGVTFNTWAVDSDTLGLSILNATAATGNWAGAGFLKAFEIKDIGNVTNAVVTSGPGAFGVTVDHGLSANLGCATGGTPGACFFTSPPLALTNSMTWTIDFTGSSLNLSAPHLKVQFLQNATDTKATGDLLSQTIPAVPEPETYAMLLAGLGLMGAVARRRQQTSVR